MQNHFSRKREIENNEYFILRTKKDLYNSCVCERNLRFPKLESARVKTLTKVITHQ